MTQRQNPGRVIVVGGGLAGMAAAVALESAGALVTLLEARKTLGGRAGSFQDPQTGQVLDNCQHILLGCCTNLIDFYRRTGASDLIHWEQTIRFIDDRAHEHYLRAISGLPAPLHLAPSLAAFSALSWRERLALSAAMADMIRCGPAARARLSELGFSDWLRDHGQPLGLIGKFYDLLLVSALNEQSDSAAASYALQVFQESLLGNASGYRLGLPKVPLGKLYERLPCQNVLLSTRMSEIRFDGPRVTGVVLQSGQALDADAVVLAVNYPALDKWISAPDPRLRRSLRQPGPPPKRPDPGAHLWYDRPILRGSHAALMSGPLQWLFRKPGEHGQAVLGVISAAREWEARNKTVALAQFDQQLHSMIPQARRAKLLRGIIVVEKRATFSPAPSSDRWRPPQAPPPGGIKNLYLAGDYTQTGWPATMEGAVRSGYLAAEAVLRDAGRNVRFLAPDLPIQWPARLAA